MNKTNAIRRIRKKKSTTGVATNPPKVDPYKRVEFLDNCVDECDVNGKLILKEYIFPYYMNSWDPKVI